MFLEGREYLNNLTPLPMDGGGDNLDLRFENLVRL